MAQKKVALGRRAAEGPRGQGVSIAIDPIFIDPAARGCRPALAKVGRMSRLGVKKPARGGLVLMPLTPAAGKAFPRAGALTRPPPPGQEVAILAGAGVLSTRASTTAPVV